MPLKDILIGADGIVRNAVEKIQNGGSQICLVVDADGRLLGTITDGDVRRGLLRGCRLETPVTEIMNRHPRTVRAGAARAEIMALMRKHLLRQVPDLDDQGRVVRLHHIDEFEAADAVKKNWVVLMAGGLGTRLRPHTDKKPKPLLSVGDKPILESILESFVEQNFRKFYISVNYKADAIKRHFGDGSGWNAEIRYLQEETRLGTAGALHLITDRPAEPLLVMNGDLVTRVNFSELLNYHRDRRAKATMCVREYDFEVPFGVVQIEDDRILTIDEKPVHRFFVNAGIYVLEPGMIDLIPGGDYFDMTDLFQRAVENGQNTAAFPIHEYWLDVGRLDDLERANLDFENGVNS